MSPQRDESLESLHLADFSEDARLAVLRSYGVLDTPADAAFDEIAKAAAMFCRTPISAVSLVEDTRQWFKAEVGLGVRETPRDVSFCAHAMHGDDLYTVHDAERHPLFSSNALVTGGPNIRFYAGAPIKSPDGAPLGALCVIDTVARPEGLTDDQAMVLQVLANQVEAQLRLRRVVQEQDVSAKQEAMLKVAAIEREERLVSALHSAEVGWWDWEIATDMVIGSPTLAQVFGLDPDEAARGLPLDAFFGNIHPADSRWLRESIDEAMETGASFEEEYRLVAPDGVERWVSARGRCLRDEHGEPWRFPGVIIDITDRKSTEQRLREADMGRELAIQAAQLGRFDHNPTTGERFMDARALEILGMTAEAAQDIGAVLAQVHDEDRQVLMEKLSAAVDPSRTGPFRHTYRFIRPGAGEERWIKAVGKTQFADGVCTRFMGLFEDVTDARRNEEHRRLLSNELNHRMKNTLAVVLSIVNNSLRAATDPAMARADINGRIMALSRANDVLTAESWSAASTSEIVQGVIDTLSLPKARLELSGEAVRLGPTPALQLALALHELATNALKYGALSNDTGKLTMAWSVEDEDGAPMFTFDWMERGGPTVVKPTRQGFGSRLIERATAGTFSGDVTLDFRPTGLHWRLKAPYAGLASAGRA